MDYWAILINVMFYYRTNGCTIMGLSLPLSNICHSDWSVICADYIQLCTQVARDKYFSN